MKKECYLFEYDRKVRNIISFLVLIVIILISSLVLKNFNMSLLDFIILIFLFFLYHILFISITRIIYYFFKIDKNKISLEISFKNYMLYFGCQCLEIVKKEVFISVYLISFMLLGIFPFILSLIFNYLPLLISSSLFISSNFPIFMCYGINKVKDLEISDTKDVNKLSLYSTKDLSKINIIGLKFIKKVSDAN